LSDTEKLRKSKPTRYFKRNKSNSPSIPLEEFRRYFEKLSSDISVSKNDSVEDFVDNHDFNRTSTSFPELDVSINISEINDTVKCLKSNNATGNDLLLNEYFMVSIDIVSSHLYDIFTVVLKLLF